MDLLIVGGGIVGAGLLRELALRGTSAVLVEKNDFASGTSSASSKLIHAGIRYLEQVWTHLKAGKGRRAWESFSFVWAASWERRRLGALAPGLIRPKSIRLVLGKNDPRSAFSVAVGVWIYYFLQILQGQFFSPPRCAVGTSSKARLAPGLDESKAKAVFTFWDSETDDARLVIECLQSAHDHGARALNYVELQGWEETPSGVRVHLVETDTGETLSLMTRILVNAGGAFVDEIRARGAGALSLPLVDRVAGSHLDVYPAVSTESYYVTASDGRLVFLLARNEDGLRYTRVGTTERVLREGESSEFPSATSEEAAYLREQVRFYFPGAQVDSTTVLRADAGIRPLRSQSGETAFQKSREHDIRREGRAYHVIGVKLTDFRRVAAEIVDRIDWRGHGVEPPSSPAASAPLRSLGSVRIYSESTPAEIVRRTMVVHWDDFLVRRGGLEPLRVARQDLARLDSWFDEVATTLCWDAARRQGEKERGQRALKRLRCPL